MLPSSPRPRPDAASPPPDAVLLSGLALLSPLALLAVVAHGWVGPWPAASHLALAVGIFPLILAAMIHFTKTLTRTGPVGWRVMLLPLLALVAGLTVVVGLVTSYRWLYPAGILGLAAAGGLLVWIEHRIGQCLGPPHPGIHWYRFALLFLLAGLTAILTGLLHPDWWLGLRAWHRHGNLFGFIGLTAMGTLEVLWPTVQARPDPETPRRCRHDLWLAGAGALMIPLGAIWNPALQLAGWLAWSIPPGRLLLQAWSHRRALRRLSVAGWSLASAMLGMILVPALDLLAPIGWVEPWRLPALYLLLILFPLVTGALTHLLPLWLLPGPQAAAQESLRQLLSRGGFGRLALFLLAGLLFAGGPPWTVLFGAAGMLAFAGQASRTWLRARRLRTQGLPSGSAP